MFSILDGYRAGRNEGVWAVFALCRQTSDRPWSGLRRGRMGDVISDMGYAFKSETMELVEFQSFRIVARHQ